MVQSRLKVRRICADERNGENGAILQQLRVQYLSRGTPVPLANPCTLAGLIVFGITRVLRNPSLRPLDGHSDNRGGVKNYK